MTDIILTQKIRDPREGQEREWYSPFFITDDNEIHINGKLNSENAVNTKNIAAKAVTGNKIYSSNNNDDRPITKNHIKNGEITFEKLDSNTIVKSRIGYSINEETGEYERDNSGQLIPNKLTNLDLGPSSVGFLQMQKFEDETDDSNRPIASSSIQNGAITYGKLYATDDDNNDNNRPVIADNIKNGSITYKKLYGSNNGETQDATKPVKGENIQSASIPLNRLSEPFYQLEKKEGTTDNILHLYPSRHLLNFTTDSHWEDVYDWRDQNQN